MLLSGNINFSCLTQTMWDTFYTCGIIGIGFGVGFTIVAIFIYKPNDNLKDDDDTKSASFIYCSKYWENYNNLESKELTEEYKEYIKTCVITEDLPFYGKTTMVYNWELGGFDYYNNRGASIPYKMLTTIARKYVVEFDCKSLYINITDELEKSRQVCNELSRRFKEKNEEDEDDVFVKRSSKLSTQIVNTALVKDNIIKFKFRGKRTDYVGLLNEKESLAVDANEVDANEVDANEVDANEVDANEVDANEKESLAVDANEVDANEVDANEKESLAVDTNEKELLAVDSKNIIKINFKTFKQMLSISNKTKED